MIEFRLDLGSIALERVTHHATTSLSLALHDRAWFVSVFFDVNALPHDGQLIVASTCSLGTSGISSSVAGSFDGMALVAAMASARVSSLSSSSRSMARVAGFFADAFVVTLAGSLARSIAPFPALSS